MEMWTKTHIREMIFEKRRFLGEHPVLEAQKNQRLRELAKSCPIFQRAEAIFVYASIRHEADTWELAKEWLSEGKRLAYPRVNGQEIEFYWIRSFSDLEVGAMKILEPVYGCERADGSPIQPVPVLVPGVAFDKKGYRLGYGGGYYDRFFAANPERKAIGYAFDFQMFEELPRDSYDWKMDMVLAEKQ